MKGWVSLHRSIQEHWVWDDPKYLKWWITILMNVNHEEKAFSVGLETFVCNPGQSFRSIEQWTSQFSCSKKTTIKFFKMLQKEEMIECKNLGKGNRRKHLLTVVNWGKYQITETENYTERVPKITPKEYRNVPPNNNVNNENNVNNREKAETAKRFQAPTLEEIKDYISLKGYSVDPELFFDHYASVGWMIGRNKMKDWQSALSKWNRTEKDRNSNKLNYGNSRRQNAHQRHGTVSCIPGDNAGSSTL